MVMAGKDQQQNLFQAMERVSTSLGSVTMKGTLLDVPAEHPMRLQGRTAILLGCVCVTDPCPCEDKSIVWVPADAIRAQTTSSDHQNGQGANLVTFSIDRDARLIVETFTSVRASEFSRRHMPPFPPLLTRRPHGVAGLGAALGADRAARQVDYWCSPHHVMYEITTEGEGLGTTFTYTPIASC